ncbi:MAG: IclR family transcriptional regulator [Thiolinea sp.]
MQTVDKAMQLLNLFSINQPEIGLSELARRAGFDKAATRRFLVALQKHQFIEQNPQTKAYRLGTGFLHLAKVREATMPLEAVLNPLLNQLSAATGETAHASLLVNQLLSSIAISFPEKANRAHLELGEVLPLHATASGIAMLAFSAPALLDSLPQRLPVHTDGTATDRTQLQRLIDAARQQGFAVGSGIYCTEVTGIAVPYFGADGQPLGALAVATPNSRLTEALMQRIQAQLLQACQQITHSIGGQLPESFRALLNRPQQAAA